MNSKLSIVLAALLAAAGCSRKLSPERAPEAQPAYTFPHSTHVDADVKCTACHAGIEKATKLEAGVRHIAIPAGASKQAPCSDCHDKDPQAKLAARTAPPRFTFSHADHLAKVSGDCRKCHRELTETGDTSPKRPPMETCTSCHHHQQEFAEARCMPCHKELRGYKPESAFKHEGDWLRAHGALARSTAESCAQCHDQTYCGECHAAATTAARPSVIYPERVERAFIHRGDYVSRHMIEAGANPASCRKCHGSPFCDSCHELQGLTKFSANLRDPHPAGWANDRASGHFHGDAARRDILNCAGCHDQGAAATCVGCHNVAANQFRGGNPNGPHPARFVRKHRGESKSSNGMCLACHPS
jgi:hypothetical protein